MKLRIENSKAKNKRFVAIFTDKNNKEKRVNFGLKNPKIGTYIDHQDKDIRRRYRARHEPPEKKFYGNPQKPSTLSKFTRRYKRLQEKIQSVLKISSKIIFVIYNG